MADWRQVVMDPDFDSLSDADKREVLQKMGAPGGFTAELLGDPMIKPGTPDVELGVGDFIPGPIPIPKDPTKVIQWGREQLQKKAESKRAAEDTSDLPKEPTWGGLAESAAVLGGGPAALVALGTAPLAFLLSVASSGVGRAASGKLGELISDVANLSPEEGETLADTMGDAGGFAAGAVGGGVPALLKRKFPGLPRLFRMKGREAYAKTVTEGDDVSRVAGLLRGLEDELPAGTAGHVRRVATKRQRAAGEEIDRVYRRNPRQVSLSNVSDDLTDEMVANTRTPAYQQRDINGNPMFDADGNPIMVDPRSKNPAYQRALERERAEVEGSAEDLLNTQGGADTRNALEMRQTTDDIIKARKSTRGFTRKAAELDPITRGLRKKRTALTDELHRVTGGPGGEGAIADRAFGAWSELKNAGKQTDTDGILRRWLISHLVPGKAGAVAGASAVRLTPLRTLSGQTRFAIARALDRGDRDAFIALVPTIQRELLGEDDDE